MSQLASRLIDVSSTESFDRTIAAARGPVLVDFWATWCGPCKALTPKLEEIATELGAQATILKVNIEDLSDIATRFAVRGVPAMLLFRDGEVRSQLMGNQSKDVILEELRKLI